MKKTEAYRISMSSIIIDHIAKLESSKIANMPERNFSCERSPTKCLGVYLRRAILQLCTAVRNVSAVARKLSYFIILPDVTLANMAGDMKVRVLHNKRRLL